MTSAAAVREQYATESRLVRRRSVWRTPDGARSPQDVAAEAVRGAKAIDVLEVGCGTGAFAERIASENPRATVVATDQSERFVALTRARGVRAQVVDVQALPFRSAAFDVVAAMWMLYHAPDVHRAVAEVRRVLRSDGLFVAATNGYGHLADLLVEAGGEPLVTGFSTENGAETLRRQFDEVRQVDVPTCAVFDNHAAAAAYLATFDAALAAGLPHFEGSREYVGATTVFLAR